MFAFNSPWFNSECNDFRYDNWFESKANWVDQVQNWSTTNIYQSEWKTIIFKRRYDRCNLSNCKLTRKHFGTSTGFEPMASALALQCSTNWAMKTHTLRAGQFVEFISTRERNRTWIKMMWTAELKNFNQAMILAVVIAIIPISRAGTLQIIFHFVTFSSKLLYNVYL